MILWLNLLLIGIAGAIGALSRYGISVGMRTMFGDHFPLGTLIVNVVGCFLLGLMTGFLDEKFLDEKTGKEVREILGVGFLGALTTFSTFALAVATRLEEGQLLAASTNAVATTVVALMAGGFGYRLSRTVLIGLRPRRTR